jgi:integrase
MARKTLTDRGIKALKPKDGPYIEPDLQVPGHGVRVMPTGHKTFVLTARYPGSKNPVPRALGSYGELTLEQSREKARQWRISIKRGIDPKDQEERQRLSEQQKRKNSFAVVCEDFFKEKLSGERKGREVQRDIKRDLMPAWGALPITEIDDLRAISIIKTKKRTPAQARNLLGTIKRLFGWIVDQRVYGLARSPMSDLKPTRIVGKKKIGRRILSDTELFALWRAVNRLPYPYGPAYRLLILAGLRLNEAADAHWSEFDLPNKIWVVPPDRMKGTNEEARPHAVPLTDDILALVESLPRFKRGKFLFSNSFGEKPAWLSDKIKKKIDARILRTLRALARRKGEDIDQVELPPWKNHDIRRTVRSNLSRLRISEEAREAVLAHARPGIKGVYDHHDYLDEKREALTLWAGRLRSIIEPPLKSDNIIRMTA